MGSNVAGAHYAIFTLYHAFTYQQLLSSSTWI